MTEKEAIKESIEHWKRMIKWVEKQEPEDPSFSHNMRNDINEDWYSKYCSLCQLYNCLICPLALKYGRCETSETENKWRNVNISPTWADWIKNAKGMLRQLESL